MKNFNLDKFIEVIYILLISLKYKGTLIYYELK